MNKNLRTQITLAILIGCLGVYTVLGGVFLWQTAGWQVAVGFHSIFTGSLYYTLCRLTPPPGARRNV